MKVVSLYNRETGEVAFTTSVQLPQGIAPENATAADWEAAVADLERVSGMSATPGAAAEGQRVVGGLLVDVPPPETTFAELQELRLALINAAFSNASFALFKGYPEAERRTWPAQEVEALAWGADSTAPTPYLDGLAAARGIEPADMRQYTLNAVTAFRAASQVLVGTRQALRDRISAASAPAELEAIRWPVE